MSIGDRMTIDERRKYLRIMQQRYLQANRKERGQLLDDLWRCDQADGVRFRLAERRLYHLLGNLESAAQLQIRCVQKQPHG